MKQFSGRLFAGRLFAGRLFRAPAPEAAPGSSGGRDSSGSARRLRQQFELDQDNLAIAMTICAGVALDMM